MDRNTSSRYVEALAQAHLPGQIVSSGAEVATQLEKIYQSRNRLAHHEPVLHTRFNDTVAAVEFVAQRLGVRRPDPASPLSNLLAGDLAAARAKAAALHAKLDTYRI